MKNVTYYNAGAGSGKTYTLTHKLADRIKEGLNPSEVILTTFTKAAAADFKERARAVLYEEGLHEEAAMIDQAIIGTVHSVGEYFIKQYWYILGLSPEMNVMDEDSTKFYINQSLAALPTNKDFELFRKFRKTFNLTHDENGAHARPYEMFWKDWLNSIIEKAVAYRVADLKNSKEYSLAKIKEILKPTHDFRLTRDQLISTLEAVRGIAANETSAKAKERVQKINEYLGKHAWGYEDFISLGTFLSPLPKGYFNKVTELSNTVAEINEIWHSNQLYNFIVEVVGRIYEMADNWRGQYKLYKQERRIIDFNDMEYYFLELLKKEEIATEIGGRYKCLMVDEFQDSSPAQVDIFNRLSDLLEESYWCGDSKQAIYGFRGADTDLTEAVVNMIPEENVDTRDTSYRSEPAVVNLCNDIFKQAFKGKLEEEQITLKPNREKTSTGPNLIHWKSAEKTSSKFIQDMAVRIAGIIKERNIPCHELAVLAFRNEELKTLSEELNGLGIPVNYESGLLNEQKETELVTAILTLLIDGHNQLAKAKIVHLAEKGWTLHKLIDNRLEDLEKVDKYLQRLKEGEEVPEEEVPMEWLNEQCLIKTIQQGRKEWLSQSVSAQVESVIVELNLRAVMKSWGKGWEQREANLCKIVNLAKDYEQYCLLMTLGATTTGFLEYLANNEVASAGDSEGVVLKTYHGSKGLEWKNVILLSLNRNVIKEDDIMKRGIFGVQKMRKEIPTKENLFPEMIISLIPWVWGKSKAPTDITAEIKDSQIYMDVERVALEESARLLYVGMTRARDRLITTSRPNSMDWIKNLGISINDVPETGEVDLFKNGNNFTVEDYGYDKEENSQMGEPVTFRDFDISALEQKTYADKFVAPSHTGLETKGEVTIVASRDKRIPLRGNTDMSETGTCIHNIYAACTGDNTHDIEIAEQIRATFHFEKVIPDAQAVIDARVYLTNWLTEKYGEPTIQHHELPFMHEVGEQIVRGSMDLVWETGKGCILVDFKTFPGTEASVTETTNEHFAGNYKPQFDCYQAALEAAGKQVIAKYVFYPVNGMIVEMK